MLEDDGALIEEIFFNDKMGIELSHTGIKKGWGDPTKKLKVESPHRDIKLNCWGAILSRGATSFHIFTNSLDGPFYVEC